MNKHKYLITFILLLSFQISIAQLIQSTIKTGPATNQVEIWLKPNFTNSTQYIYQMVFPIAFPANANPQPTGISVSIDPAFTAAFGDNYTYSINPLAQNTGGTEKYYGIFLVRGGLGASNPQTWTLASEFKVLTVTFLNSGVSFAQIKLADYQDGGSDGQGNFYTVSGNANYYVTPNSVGNFYPTPGFSVIGGTASAGYVQTIANITLPVNLLSFSGYSNAGKNILTWSTSQEINNRGFEIQRSYDGINYNIIGFVNSVGNYTGSSNYTFDDINPTGSRQYYRLRIEDMNHNSKLSNTVIIRSGKRYSLSIETLYPNPALTKLNAVINAPTNDYLSLVVVDINGKLVDQQLVKVQTGSNTIMVEVGHLSSGSYILELRNKNYVQVSAVKFVKQ